MFAVTPFLRVGFVKFPGSGVKGCGWVGVWKKDGSCFARMPTHAMRLHEWGTRGIGAIFMYGPPAALRECPHLRIEIWGTQFFSFNLDVVYPRQEK
jgi:hypothetical protein